MRESMKSISRIFSAVACSASLFAFDAVGAVATTAGNNLTAYNPSNAYNNQWATMVNPRNDNVSAKADFGNCNAVISRCAQPKCANGGCIDKEVAAGIVKGCVLSNDKCKQYGDALIEAMTMQLVANSTSKANAVNAEQIQAAQMAAQQAQAAAQEAQMAQQQQMAEMQSSMQQQMMQMQQQMAEQNAQAAQQLQEALAANQAQQQQAISDMRSAAESAAAAQVSPSSPIVTAPQQEAIDRGVSADVLQREQISGQVLQEIESAETALEQAREAMERSFQYAGCDSQGDNCAGPKRIRKWREITAEFIEPYNKSLDKIYDALMVAQTVGVDLSDIYMMLNNSCNSWGEYLCPSAGGKATIVYNPPAKDGQVVENKGAPRVCPRDVAWEQCQPCTLLKILPNNTDDIYEGWVNATNKMKDGNEKVVACASSAMANSALFGRRVKSRNGANIIDIEFLSRWLNQKEPGSIKTKKSGETASQQAQKYCGYNK